MSNPKELLYAKSHEWIRVDGDKAYIGITDFAQNSLGDIVYVELPELDDEFDIDDEVTSIESVKAAAPIYTPLSGTIVEVNEDLEDSPEMINEKPYDAYIFALELSDKSELDGLMDKDAYEAFIEEESK